MPGVGRVYWGRKPREITRLLQPAGQRPQSRPLRWSDGFALRLPFGRALLLDRHPPRRHAGPRA